MDWAALWSRGDRLATTPELVLNYLELLWRRRESNPAHGSTIDVDRALLRGGSGKESGDCAVKGEDSTSIENGRTTLSRSNVAKGLRDALLALAEGRLDIARTRLAELLEEVET